MPPNLRAIQDHVKERKGMFILLVCGLLVVLLVIIVAVALSRDQQPGEEDSTTLAPDDPPVDGSTTVSPRVPDDGEKYTEALALYKSWFKGDGTYYGPEGEGTCQIAKNNLPPAARNSKYLAALNVEQFLKSATCGMCFRLKGEGKGLGTDPIIGDFIVFVKDLCPVCKEGDIDLAINGDGRWDIEIRAVQCPVDNTFLQYAFQGSNEWYLKLQVRNGRVPPHKVQAKNLQGTWISFTLSKDGHWIGKSHFDKTGDIPVRLTSIAGAVVDDVIPRLVNDVVMDGKKKVQFPLDSSLPNA